MSNEPIYPLSRYGYTSVGGSMECDNPDRSVNQRLAPIFKALLDDPEGWEYDIGDSIPTTHEGCDNFRLTPKRKTISVEIPVPDGISQADSRDYGPLANVSFRNQQDRDAFIGVIRSAMEGK